jgi:hypothetical protein
MRILCALGLAVSLTTPLAGQADKSHAEKLEPSMRSVKLYLGREKHFVVRTFEQGTDRTNELGLNFDAWVEDSSVASIETYGHMAIRVVGRNYGSTRIIIRSKRNATNVVRVPVKVLRTLPMPSWFGMGATASARMISPFGSDVKRGRHYLEVRATITNALPIWRMVPLTGCALSVRIYRTASRRDKPLGGPQGICSDTTTSQGFAPFQSRRYKTEYNEISHLDHLIPGRYYVSALINRGRNFVEVDAGSIVVREWDEGLTLTASVTLTGDSIRVRPVFHNANRRTVGFHYDAIGCSSHLVIYRDGDPAWMMGSGRRPLMFPNNCPQGHSAKVAGRDSVSPVALNLAIPVTRVLGDSLPDGSYLFMTMIDAAGQLFRAYAGSLYLSRVSAK